MWVRYFVILGKDVIERGARDGGWERWKMRGIKRNCCRVAHRDRCWKDGAVVGAVVLVGSVVVDRIWILFMLVYGW
jgi:hypothetical protein